MKFLALSILLGATLFGAIFVTLREGTHAITSSSPLTGPGEPGKPADGVRSPVIVELFTSEGCSSCPPADAALIQLQKAQPVAGAEIIALSEHVDYWNYIGWSDPFSSATFSARQETYAQAFKQERIYTPQMIVDGKTEFVGNSLEKARDAITKAAESPKADVKIMIPQTTAELNEQAIKLGVSVKNVPSITKGDVAEVILAITEDNLSSNVSRGENTGRKLAHTAVVREIRALGGVDPSTRTFDSETTLAPVSGWKREDLRIVAFVQERAHRRVLGAAVSRLSRTQPRNR